jgi:hypothetical protein
MGMKKWRGAERQLVRETANPPMAERKAFLCLILWREIEPICDRTLNKI